RAADGGKRLLRAAARRPARAGYRGTAGSARAYAAQRQAAFAHGYGDVSVECWRPCGHTFEPAKGRSAGLRRPGAARDYAVFRGKAPGDLRRMAAFAGKPVF